VESEHSAMACIIAAATAGVRTFTATSANGLALMHELLHWAAGARLPLVMVNVNRAMAPGWSIWSDQTDSLAQRDTGWLQFYCEDNQEVLDTLIQAYWLAERVLLPVMVCYDAFWLSHTYEPVDIPDQKDVDDFLPPYKPEIFLDVDNPRSFYGLAMPDHYMEMRYKMQRAMEKAVEVAAEADQKFKEKFGRGYGIIETMYTDDAEVVLVTSSTITSASRVVIEKLRGEGHKVGLLKARMFRPFPDKAMREALSGKKRVLVLDRNISFGKGGIFADEIRGALSNDPNRPAVYGYVTGLGGRDITPEDIEGIVKEGMSMKEPPGNIIWKGVKL